MAPLAGVFNIALFAGWTLHAFLLFMLSTPVQFWLGGTFYKGAYAALKNHSANMDVLVAFGTPVAVPQGGVGSSWN